METNNNEVELQNTLNQMACPMRNHKFGTTKLKKLKNQTQ